MNRRTFLAVSSPSFVVSVAGCLTEELDELTHNCFREEWPVVLYNESASRKSVAVTITDAADRTVFSETIEVAPSTDPSTGIELDREVHYAQFYTFEAAISGGEVVVKETTVKCGPIYIFVTESGEVLIRDDSHAGD